MLSTFSLARKKKVLFGILTSESESQAGEKGKQKKNSFFDRRICYFAIHKNVLSNDISSSNKESAQDER